MLKYLQQNKNIFIVALGLFIASMSTLLFFLNDGKEGHDDLKTNVVDSITLKSHQEEERIYRDLIGNHEDPVIVLSLDGTIDFASWEFEANAGYKQKELKGELFFTLLHPEDLGTFMTAFGKAIETEKNLTMIGPYRLRDANEEYRVHMGSVYPLKEHGKIAKIGVSTRDITYEIEQTEADAESEHYIPIVKKKAKSQTVAKPTPPTPEPPPAPEPASPKLNPLKNEPDWIKGNRLVMNFLF